jgi:hypothetical protein
VTEAELRKEIDELVDAVQGAQTTKQLADLKAGLDEKLAELNTLQR